MTELLNCPFCGGEAFVNDDPTGNGGKPHMSGSVGIGRLWSVECDECGADSGFQQGRDIAIAAWNTRAERTCKNELSEEQFGCSECGCHLPVVPFGSTYVSQGKRWYSSEERDLNYCPSCGAKVVSA